MDNLKNMATNALGSIASSVKDKVISSAKEYVCGSNENKNRMFKKMGANNSQIQRMGVSNQKIKKRMGV